MAGLLTNDRLAVLPTLEQIRAWVDSVFAPNSSLAVAAPVHTPDYNQSMAQATPVVAPVVNETAKDAVIGHVLAAPVPIPVSDYASAPLEGSVSRTITYGYDDLYRLKTATYNDGTSFVYTYDAVGNRLTEVTTGGLSISYIYDNANRLTSVDGIPYGWDNNGNLLSDGASTYTYDKANRMKTVVQGSTTYGNVYNGQGDRLRQTVNGVPTTYVLDLNAGLTQVLSDGSNTYLYGASRIAEKQTGGWRYYAGDALGSVRQLVDNTGAVTLAKSYRPFGDPFTSAGTGATMYAFTGEQRDASGLVFLRARYNSAAQGRFLTRDTWYGNANKPMSLNRWAYAYENPVNYTDPTGRFPEFCQAMSTKALYEGCVPAFYNLEPISYFSLGSNITGQQGCYQGKIDYRGPGYLEGVGGYEGVIGQVAGGVETVYDLPHLRDNRFGMQVEALQMPLELEHICTEG